MDIECLRNTHIKSFGLKVKHRLGFSGVIPPLISQTMLHTGLIKPSIRRSLSLSPFSLYTHRVRDRQTHSSPRQSLHSSKHFICPLQAWEEDCGQDWPECVLAAVGWLVTTLCTMVSTFIVWDDHWKAFELKVRTTHSQITVSLRDGLLRDIWKKAGPAS
jgi:hypothetical protein